MAENLLQSYSLSSIFFLSGVIFMGNKLAIHDCLRLSRLEEVEEDDGIVVTACGLVVKDNEEVKVEDID